MRRRTYRRRRRATRRPRRSRWQIYGAAGRQLVRDVAALKNVVNAESHYFDDTATATAVDWSGTTVDLCTPSQGDTDTQRSGDSIKLENLRIKGSVNFNTGASVASQTVTLIVVFYPQVPLVGSAVSDYLEETGTALAPFSPKDHDNRFNCRTLIRRTYSVSADKDIVNFTIRWKFRKNEHTQFDNAGTTILRGKLKMYLISNSNSAGANHPYVNYYARTHFWDN